MFAKLTFISGITSLDVSNRSIGDLTGIEAFVSLSGLSCGRNLISHLDVSDAVDLIYLYCDSNELTSLDVSNNTKLKYLYCYYNQLSNLDVSQNKGAADLWIIKISDSGDLISEKTFGGTSFDVGRSISKTQDNGFLISGSSRSLDGDLTENKGQNDAWIIKLNSNTDIEWQRTVGGSEVDFGYDLVELNNKTVVMVGDSNSSDGDIIENKGFSDILLVTFK